MQLMHSSFDPPRFVRLLELLKEHGSEYLSGQDLSDVLKISRIAVWKHVERLRTLGYGIDSDKTHGYRLADVPDAAYPWEVTGGLGTKTLGKIAYYFDAVESTQDFAAELATDPAKNGAVVISDVQSAGRGRGKNSWSSPSGGIWMSVVLGDAKGYEPTLVPIAAAVALSKALHETLGTSTELKWPNDVLVKSKKVAGIIIDAVSDQNGVGKIVLGIGINYNVSAEAIRTATKRKDVATLESSVQRVKIVQRILQKLEKEIASMSADGGAETVRRWTERSCTIGSMVCAESEGVQVEGVAERMAEDGSLMVRSGKNVHRIVSGEILDGLA